MTYTPARREATFWSRVNKDGPTQPHMETPCWVWGGTLQRHGYGIFGSKPRIRAHRYAFALTKGDPGDSLVLHECDFRQCVRPDHLKIGSHASNMADRTARCRSATGQRNGTHTHPDRRATGDRAGLRVHPERAAKGDRNGASKLTSANVLDIHRMARAGQTRRSIAETFAVSPSHVGRILRGLWWKHIHDDTEETP